MIIALISFANDVEFESELYEYLNKNAVLWLFSYVYYARPLMKVRKIKYGYLLFPYYVNWNNDYWYKEIKTIELSSYGSLYFCKRSDYDHFIIESEKHSWYKKRTTRKLDSGYESGKIILYDDSMYLPKSEILKFNINFPIYVDRYTHVYDTVIVKMEGYEQDVKGLSKINKVTITVGLLNNNGSVIDLYFNFHTDKYSAATTDAGIRYTRRIRVFGLATSLDTLLNLSDFVASLLSWCSFSIETSSDRIYYWGETVTDYYIRSTRNIPLYLHGNLMMKEWWWFTLQLLIHNNNHIFSLRLLCIVIKNVAEVSVLDSMSNSIFNYGKVSSFMLVTPFNNFEHLYDVNEIWNNIVKNGITQGDVMKISLYLYIIDRSVLKLLKDVYKNLENV